MRHAKALARCALTLAACALPATAAAQQVVLGSGPGSSPVVRVLTATDDRTVPAYDPTFLGGVSVALGDVNGDGTPDVITGAGPGGGPHVRVLSGTDLHELHSFFAYDPGFSGGVHVAAGDINGDGRVDIITAAGPGGPPHVRVFSGTDLHELASFYAHDPGFSGGVQVAAGDINGDGRTDLITGAGPGGGPHVQVFSGVDLHVLQSFFAYDPGFSGGVEVAAGDINGDGRTDLIVGAGPGGGPHVQVFSGVDLHVLVGFFPYDPGFAGGVHVAAGDLDGDGRTDLITGPGPGGPPQVRVFSGVDGHELASFLAFATASGVTVGSTGDAGTGVRFTSPASTNFLIGSAGSFTVTAVGTPLPALSATGARPAGVTFVPHGDGTATLAGTPGAGTSGAYPLTFTAANGVGSPAVQQFILTVQQAPAITSAPAVTFTIGTPGTFTVAAAGFPVPTLTLSGGLPAGVSFVDHGNGTGLLSGAPAGGTASSYALQVMAANGAGTTIQAFTLTVRELFVPGLAAQLVLGRGPGSSPDVRVITTTDDRTVPAYGPTFLGGMSVALGDIDGDGTLDIITGAGPGGGPHVRVLSGTDLHELYGFFAYPPDFAGGVSVASGDIDGDGRTDIITGAGPGRGPHVQVFSGVDLRVLHSFFAYDPSFAGGVQVAAGDIDGDGRTDLITGAGPGGGPHVQVFSGVDLHVLASFFAYAPGFRGGVSVAAGDIDGDGRIDLVTGAGPGGGPHVQVFSGVDFHVLAGFFAYDPGFAGGVHVAAGDLDGDGRSDLITGPGPGGPPLVRVFSGVDGHELASFLAFATGSGVSVSSTGGGVVNEAPSFTKGADPTVLEDAGAQTIASWATAISAGTGETQVVTFEITGNTNAALFSAGPAVNGTNGALTFTPAANANGSATITLRARDDGGTANGGVDVSPTQAFVITVTAVNDPPTFLKGPDQVVLEDSGAHTVNSWATAISPGPPNESGQTRTFVVAGNTNTGLFSAGPSVDPSGVLTFTPAAHAFGTATITLRLDDSGGTANGGANQSATQTFVLTVTNVNDAPSFTKGADQTVPEDAVAQSVTPWATGISAGPNESDALTFTVTNTNNALFSIQPAVAANGTLTYTLAPNQNGVATVSVSLTDDGTTPGVPADNLTTAVQTFTITTTPDNDAPVADNETYGVNEGGTITEVAPGVLTGDTDVEGSSLTAVLVSGPAHASSFTLNADGSFTYTHDGSETLADSFTYRASDGALNSNVATVTIAVTPINDAPVADDDAYGVNEGATLTQPAPGVLNGDIDAEGSALTVILVAGPAHASSFTLNANGSFTYAHNGSETTTDSFTYRATDGLLNSNLATATITITPVNDAPVLDLDANNSGGTSGANYAITFTEDDPAAFLEDVADATITDADHTTLASLTVTLTNLLDPAFELVDVDLTGFPLFSKAYDTTTDPARGVLTITATPAQPIANFVTLLRKVTYRNTDDNPATTPRVITFVANDGTGTSNTATSTVTVVAVNDAPTAGADGYTVAEGGTLTIVAPGVLDGDVDPEGSVLTANLVSGPAQASSFTLNTDGGFTYTHNGSETTSDSFTYQASDGALDSNTATVTITVTGVNDPPVAVDDVGTTNENTVLSVPATGVLANDTDPDAGDTKTVVLVNGGATVGSPITTAKSATLTLNANGSYTYDPTAVAVFQGLGTGQSDTDSFTYTMRDTAAVQSTATVTITITGVNDAPVVATGAGSPSFTEDSAAVTIAPLLTVTDVDDATIDSATVQITGNYQNGQDVLAFTNQLGITGNWVPATGTLTLSGSATLASYETALHSVTYSNTSQDPTTTARTVQFVANDSEAASAPVTKSLAVVAVNDAPVITVTAGTTLTFTEGQTAQVIDTGIAITDVDDTNINSATLQITANFEAAFDILAFTNQLGITGNWVAGTGTLTLAGTTTKANYVTALESVTFFNGSNNPSAAPRTVTWTVNDGDLNSAAVANTIAVIPVNDAPIVINETFDLLGNTELRVDLASVGTPHTSETTAGVSSVKGVLDNDSDPEGDPFTVTAIANCAVLDTTAPFDCTLTGGAVVHVEANGEFSYTPAPGATSGSFTYTVTDQPLTGLPSSVAGTVSFTFFDLIWYVDGDVAGPGTGTSSDPFNSFATLNGAGGAGDVDHALDYIFVHDSVAGLSTGIELEANQHLIGEFAGLSISRNLNGNGSPTNLVTAGGGARSAITNTAGNAITIGTAVPVEIAGLALSASANAIDLTTAAALTGSGTLIIANNEIRSAGAEGIDINLNPGTIGTLALTIQDNTWNTANAHIGNGVDIIRSTGTLILSVNGNTNIKSNGTAVLINGVAFASTTITGFSNNTVHTDTLGAGVAISQVTFDSNPALGGIQQVDGDTLAIGLDGNGVGAAGMSLTAVQGNLFFDDLDVYGGTTGLGVSLGGSVMTLSVTPSTSGGTSEIKAANGSAVTANQVALDLRLSELASTTTASGVTLNFVTGQFSAPSGSAISKTSGAGTAFSVLGSNATITYGGSLNVTSGAGVSLTTNTGSTITFHGGMTLSTGSSAGFVATGGGTVNVCDENPCNPAATGALLNTIATTTGTALNVANTTIGANRLEFRSISASGAANGIVLNNTGSTGGLTVTGTAGAGTGGTIQNTTGDGISLTSTNNVSLTNLTINGTGSGASSTPVGETGATDGHGIEMRGGSNLTLTGAQVLNAGSGDNEHGVYLFNVTGTVSVQGSTITDAEETLLHVDSNNGSSMTLNVGTTAPSTFTHGALLGDLGSFTGNGILFTARGTSNYNITISNSAFNNIKGFAFQFGGDATSAGTNNNITIDDNDFLTTVVNSSGNPNNRANTLNIQGRTTIDIDATVTNNTISGGGGGGIQFGADESSNINANITGNAVSNQFADGVLIGVDENASLTVLIDNNTISNTSSDGMELSNGISPGGVSTLNATITNNIVNGHNNNAGANAFVAGIAVFGGVEAADVTNLDIRDNNVSGNPNPGVFFDYYTQGFGDTIAVEGPGTGTVPESQFLTPGTLGNVSGSPASGRTFLADVLFNNSTNVPLPVITP